LRKWLPLVAICAGTFMFLVDSTIVIVAPDIAGGLDTSLQDLQWVHDLYALVLASLVLTGGSIADRYGPHEHSVSCGWCDKLFSCWGFRQAPPEVGRSASYAQRRKPPSELIT
jgi:MFS family permease